MARVLAFIAATISSLKRVVLAGGVSGKAAKVAPRQGGYRAAFPFMRPRMGDSPNPSTAPDDPPEEPPFGPGK